LEELKRVLRPGSPVAIEEEDRSLEPQTHPVWERLRWAFFDDASWLWYETRVRKPYLDRRYMLLLDPEGEIASRLRSQAFSVQARASGLPVVDFNDAGIPLEQALPDVTEGQWSEAKGFDPWMLRQLLEKTDFGDIRFWLLPDGAKLAHRLKENHLLNMMPGDVRGILRSVLGSMQSTDIPVSCAVSCRTP
jgi:hypothetical protein